jgi:hypothetical protein
MRSWLATTSAPLRWAVVLSSSSFFWTSAIFWSTRVMRSRTTVRCSSICCEVVALSASSRWMRASIWRPLSTGTQQAEAARSSANAIRFFIRSRFVYCATTSSRRFCCQQLSVASMQLGRSLP